MRPISLLAVAMLLLCLCGGCSPNGIVDSTAIPPATSTQTQESLPATTTSTTTASQSTMTTTNTEASQPHPFAEYLNRKLTDREMAAALVGHWHEGPDISSCYGNRYVFYENGAYAFYPSENSSLSRLGAHTGTYTVSNGYLNLYATHQMVMMGGMLVDKGLFEYQLVDASARIVAYEEPMKIWNRIWPMELELDFPYDEQNVCLGVKLSMITDDYWLFKPFEDIADPPSWQADTAVSPDEIEAIPDELYYRLWRPWKPADILNEDGLPIYTPYGIGSFFSESTMFDFEDEYTSVEEILYGYGEDFWDGCSMWCNTAEWESATASSTLDSVGSTDFKAENVNISRKNITWCEGVAGYGIGQWLEIVHTAASGGEVEWGDDYQSYILTPNAEPLYIPYTGFCIVNGYAKNPTLWQQNSRVKRLKLYVNGEAFAWLDLEDTVKPQYFPLDGLTVTSTSETVFRFEIASIYPGDLYEDTCITGIEIGFDGFGH